MVETIHPCTRAVDDAPFRPSQLGAEFASYTLQTCKSEYLNVYLNSMNLPKVIR